MQQSDHPSDCFKFYAGYFYKYLHFFEIDHNIHDKARSLNKPSFEQVLFIRIEICSDYVCIFK